LKKIAQNFFVHLRIELLKSIKVISIQIENLKDIGIKIEKNRRLFYEFEPQKGKTKFEN